jgi:hypothetical protein
VRARDGRAPGGARFVIDASGQAASSAVRAATDASTTFKNLAVFGYFTGAERLPSELANHSRRPADGWFWYIPLHDIR